MELKYDGKVAVITGGVRGIGFATARILAKGGAKIALVDIKDDLLKSSAEKLAGETGAPVIGVRADVTNEEDVRKMAATVKEKLGPADIFVSSAAIVDDKRFLDSSLADWKRMIDICLYGPMLCMHALLPSMVERQYGRVICLISDSARVGQARLSYYAAAKAGVVAITKSIAQEVGRNGVTLNMVSPGSTNTEMRQDREKQMREKMGEEKYQQHVKNVLRGYPVGRIGEPQDIASAIAFFASEQASWITGQILSVNGGYTML